MPLGDAWSQFAQDHPVRCERPWLVAQDVSRIAEIGVAMRMVVPVNILGLPSCAVPVGCDDRLPQGVPLIGARFREDLPWTPLRRSKTGHGPHTHPAAGGKAGLRAAPAAAFRLTLLQTRCATFPAVRTRGAADRGIILSTIETALLVFLSYAMAGCMTAHVGEVSYLSPSVDVPNARLRYPNNSETGIGISSRILPTALGFDLAGVKVEVQESAYCIRDRKLGLLVVLPVLYWFNDSDTFVITVAISGERVSVDPAQITLQDETGTAIPGIVYSLEHNGNILFEAPCASDTYELVLRGVSRDGRPIELPSVHFARGSVGSANVGRH